MKARRKQCPGGCGRVLRRTMFSCSECWCKLPPPIQRPISATIGKPLSPSKIQAWSVGAAFLGRSRR